MMRIISMVYLACLWRCASLQVTCFGFAVGEPEVGCGREWTRREVNDACGVATRPCPVRKATGMDPADCGKCIQLKRGAHGPIHAQIIGGNVDGGTASYDVTARAYHRLHSNSSSGDNCDGDVLDSVTEEATDCRVEGKCRDFVAGEAGTCNCYTDDSDFENCGHDANNPCVVGMQDAGPLGVNQCNECYQLQLPGSSLLHVRVVDQFDLPLAEFDEWRMQVSRYVYDRLTGAAPPRNRQLLRRTHEQPEELNNTCEGGSATVDFTYTTTRCYDGPEELCPQEKPTTEEP
eukprot:Polyplicarium_translucidae@DN3368_c2_g6_i1.p1